MNYRETTNPVLKEGVFRSSIGHGLQGSMTARGTLNRTAFLLVLVIAAAAYSWNFPFANLQAMGSKLTIFLLIGLGLAITTMVKKEWSPYTAPAYSVAEGLVLGTLSRMLNLSFPGIIMQAVALTLGIFAVMLLLYRFQIIRVGEKLSMIIVGATLGVFALYMLSFIFQLITGSGFSFIQSPSVFGIAFSLFVVVLAAMNLLLNFDFVDRVANVGAPKYMEWYAAFGLIVTLVWLYIEVLNLLTKLRQE